MILVTGAAGKTGKAVVKALAAKGVPVRALARKPQNVSALQLAGAAQAMVADFEEPAALARAAQGVQAIYHICPNVSGNELAYARAIAGAARTAGVKRFVYHSVLHPQIEAMPHHWAKMQAEDLLLAERFELTVLQPTAYMQNILGAWRGIIADGVYRAPYPVETRLSLVDLADVAEVAAMVLTQPGHAGATYELVGTDPLTATEVATALSTALKRNVRAEVEPIEDWDARARASGMGEHERVTLAAMFRYYAAHGLIGNPKVLQWLLGRAPNNLARFLGRVGARGVDG
jgi:NAD(P)H dehydrogenase (quinone)